MVRTAPLHSVLCLARDLERVFREREDARRSKRELRKTPTVAEPVPHGNTLPYMNEELLGAFSEEETVLVQFGEHFQRMLDDIPNVHWGFAHLNEDATPILSDLEALENILEPPEHRDRRNTTLIQHMALSRTAPLRGGDMLKAECHQSIYVKHNADI